jgi:hypothetical protein
MEKNLAIYEYEGKIEEFINLVSEDFSEDLTKTTMQHFDAWLNDEIVIIDNRQNNELPEEIIHEIQKCNRGVLIRVTNMKIFKLRPEFEVLKNYLYCTRIRNIEARYYQSRYER